MPRPTIARDLPVNTNVLRLPVLLLLSGGLLGCAQMENLRDRIQSDWWISGEDHDPAATQEVVRLLQQGRMEEADHKLDRVLAQQPDDALARDLRRQLDVDPQEELGRSYTTHTVRPGETLGQLARRYLGDANRFVILARYNNIENPSRLLVGQRLRIPDAARRAPASDDDLDQQLQALGTDGEPSGAQAADAYRRAIEADLSAERYAAARTAARQARDSAPRGAGWEEWLEPLAEAAEAGYWEQRGMAALRDGDREGAAVAFRRALEFDPERPRAARHYPALSIEVKQGLHAEAIRHYRNQDLETAISLWERALEVDPEYEPARGYRLRALELQRRVDALGES